MKNILALLSILLVSCGTTLPKLDDFDAAKWKNDRNGCLGERSKMESTIIIQKDKLLKLKEMQIVQLLGRPDTNELYERNQKFYTYSISPGQACGSHLPSVSLEIRFNAMGISKEVLIK
jgi:hypothetical protein